MSMMPRSVLNMPEKIGNYEVQSVIGEGTMGIVYKGKDPKFSRFVALKTMHKHLLSGPDDRLVKRSYAEAQALGGLNHANIVTIYDLIEFEGMPVIVMEFAEGRTLYDYLEERSKISVRDALKIVSQVLDALDYAHSRGLIHRDIKPANIMIRDRASIKVMDFGVAKIQDSDMTMHGEVFGAPNYMSPEQWKGREIDARTDIFAVGVLFYQLLTGVKPFEGENFHQTRENILNVDPDPPSHINPTIPAELNEVVAKAMARERDARYQSAAEFRHALETAEETMALPPKEPTLPGVRNSDGSYRPKVRVNAARPGWLIPGASAGVAIFLAAMGWFWFKPAQVEVPVSRPPVVTAPTQEAKKVVGRVRLTSEPTGARVTLSHGELLGVTPITITKEPGFYQIIVSKEGFEEIKSGMDVGHETDTTLNVTLTAMAPSPAAPLTPEPVVPKPVESKPTANLKIPPPQPISPPREVQRSIRATLNRIGHHGVRISVSKDYVAALSGTVKTEQGKDDVLGIARIEPGVKEVIDQGLQVSSNASEPNVRLTRELRAKLRGYKVAFTILAGGRVLLRGKLSTQEQIDTVVQIAQNTEGVRSVVSRLKANAPTASVPAATPSNYTNNLVASINSALRSYRLQDTGERTNIRAKLGEWNVVVLTGSARNGDQAKTAMEAARRLVGAQMQIKNDITVLQ